MLKKIGEKRQEPRIPLEIRGIIKRPSFSESKKCIVKNLSLHGALIHFDEPLDKNELVQISLEQGINNYYKKLGVVKWCRNGTIPYRIGVYFNKEVDIPISLKDLSKSIEEYVRVSFRSEEGHSTLVNNFYINLFKDSIPQLYIGHLCSFFKNKIIDIFQSISSESNIIFLQIKRLLNILEQKDTQEIEKNIYFFYNHIENINNELVKIKNFLHTIDNNLTEVSEHPIDIIDFKKILSDGINSFFHKVNAFGKVEISYDLSANIPIFIGRTYILKTAIDMIFGFITNYIFFYNANKIHIYISYQDKTISINCFNNGSDMFKDDIFICKQNLLSTYTKNKFINFLKFIVIILEEYDASIKIRNESGNNMISLNLSIKPV